MSTVVIRYCKRVTILSNTNLNLVKFFQVHLGTVVISYCKRDPLLYQGMLVLLKSSNYSLSKGSAFVS